MSGAERLREAAKVMRERAEACMPFTQEEGWWQRGPLIEAFMALGGESEPLVQGGREDADYIASWHPAVALAVADWLEAEARDRVGGLHEGGIPPAALAVADAYLGSPS